MELKLVALTLCSSVFNCLISFSYGHLNESKHDSNLEREVEYDSKDIDISLGLPERARKGSSTYNVENYQHGVSSGNIYWDGNSSTWIYPGTALPTICTNRHEKRPDKRMLGFFICPRREDPKDFMFCCGQIENETCCDILTAKMYYKVLSEQSPSEYYLTNAGVVLTILGIIFCPFVCISLYREWKRRRHDKDLYSS